jgi:FlaG/FlaF family flagellin (archaellin)
MYDTRRENNGISPVRIGVYVLVSLLVLIGIIMGAIAGFKAFGRYQSMSDAKNQAQVALVKANNNVKVTEIEIKNQGQRVKVAQQQAQIRFESAKGVREAQDEIAKTLTPLYVQFEMTEALKEIAKSGKNSSVVYIPSGANGVPLVSGVQGQPSVTSPEK